MDALSQDIGRGSSLGLAHRMQRRWWLVLLCGLLGALGGLLLNTVTPKTYQATTSVLVLPTGTVSSSSSVTGGRTTGDLNMDTEVQVVRSSQVATVARDALPGNPEPAAVVRDTSVSVPPNSQVLAITYSASAPADAQVGSLAVANAYLKVRGDQAKQDIASQVAALQKQRDNLTASLQKATGQQVALPGSPTQAYANAQVDLLKAQILNLNAMLTDLQTTPVSAGTVIATPVLPTKAVAPVLLLDLASGLLVGLLVGLGLAYLLARRERRVHDAADLQEQLGRPVLAELGGRVERLDVLPVVRGGAVFDRLRLLLAGGLAAGSGAVMVSPVSSGNGAALVAANLAVAEARGGLDAILVCAAPGSPTAALLGVGTGPGLAEVMLGTAEIATALQEVPGRERLAVLAPGRDLAAVLDRVPADRLVEVLRRLRAGSSRVVVETAPTSSGLQAQELGRLADASLVVVEQRRDSPEAIRGVVQELEEVGAEVSGFVLVEDVSRATPPNAPVRAGKPADTTRGAAPSR